MPKLTTDRATRDVKLPTTKVKVSIKDYLSGFEAGMIRKVFDDLVVTVSNDDESMVSIPANKRDQLLDKMLSIAVVSWDATSEDDKEIEPTLENLKKLLPNSDYSVLTGAVDAMCNESMESLPKAKSESS